MEGDRISYHESVLKAYERIKKDGMTNVWDRYEAQGLGKIPIRDAPFAWVVSAVICAPMGLAAPMQKRTSGGFAVLRIFLS